MAPSRPSGEEFVSSICEQYVTGCDMLVSGSYLHGLCGVYTSPCILCCLGWVCANSMSSLDVKKHGIDGWQLLINVMQWSGVLSICLSVQSFFLTLMLFQLRPKYVFGPSGWCHHQWLAVNRLSVKLVLYFLRVSAAGGVKLTALWFNDVFVIFVCTVL